MQVLSIDAIKKPMEGQVSTDRCLQSSSRVFKRNQLRQNKSWEATGSQKRAIKRGSNQMTPTGNGSQQLALNDAKARQSRPDIDNYWRKIAPIDARKQRLLAWDYVSWRKMSTLFDVGARQLTQTINAYWRESTSVDARCQRLLMWEHVSWRKTLTLIDMIVRQLTQDVNAYWRGSTFVDPIYQVSTLIDVRVCQLTHDINAYWRESTSVGARYQRILT